MKVDEIGFLNIASDFNFEGGTLTKSSEFSRAKRWVERYVNEDGFIYPPVSHKAKIDPITGKQIRIAKTQRPALLYKMPPSHNLFLKGLADIRKSRIGLAGFVTQCFAFLFGTRLQFTDWWVEGRIPIRPTTNAHPDLKTAEHFISKSIRTWRKLDTRNKMVVSNMLYLYSKSGSMEWDWERFQLEYTVFDACHAIVSRQQSWPSIPHKKRFKKMCQFYGLRYNGRLVQKFVYLRNNLIHEALWDGGQVHTARSSASFMAGYHLRRFNHRLIAAILTGSSEYTSSPWWSLGTFSFKV